MNIELLPDLKHCYCDYTLKEAVTMVQNSAERPGTDIKFESVEQVQDYLKEMIKSTWYVWITGQRAMELITAHLENKPVKDVSIP